MASAQNKPPIIKKRRCNSFVTCVYCIRVVLAKDFAGKKSYTLISRLIYSLQVDMTQTNNNLNLLKTLTLSTMKNPNGEELRDCYSKGEAKGLIKTSQHVLEESNHRMTNQELHHGNVNGNYLVQQQNFVLFEICNQ